MPLIVFLVGMPLVLGLAVALFRSHFVPLFSCSNDVLSEQIAPGGAHRAIVFRRNCGATTPFVTNVSVLPAGAPLPDDGGDGLVLRDVHGVTIAWASSTQVAIGYPAGAEAFLTATEVHGVAVTLEPR